MSESGGTVPRRALPADPELSDVVSPSTDAAPQPRRRRWSRAEAAAAPVADDQAAADAGGTPIPPPAPVLPASDEPTPVGRRFSAAEPTLDPGNSPRPRRSAISPSGWGWTPASPTSPPSSQPSPPAVSATSAAVAPSPALTGATRVGGRRVQSGTAPHAAGRRAVGATSISRTGGAPATRPPALWVGAAALATLLIALVLFLLPKGAGVPVVGPTSTPTPTVDVVATRLLGPADLGALRPGATWQIADTLTKVDASSPIAVCVTPTSTQDPKPTSTLLRTLTIPGDASGAVLHQVDAHASPENAAAAYQARVNQLATCASQVAVVPNSHAVTGLADEAIVFDVVRQESAAARHRVVITRVGPLVNLVDTTQPEAGPGVEATVAVVATALSRQCATSGGTCPDKPTATLQTPPAVDPPGWLSIVDIPRLTPGAGQWRGTPIDPLRISGTQCEAVELTNPPGTLTKQQRTYLLADDTRAAGLGLDMVTYTFATPAEALAFVTTMTGNIDGCPGRTATAQVRRSGQVDVPDYRGASWAVTQKLAGEATTQFRVGVIASGPKAVYVFANPSPGLDFSDGDWQFVLQRAMDRAKQAG